VRQFKPRKIVEIGGGTSTLLIAQALKGNQREGFAADFESIEPYPSAVVRQGVPGLTKLTVAKVQDVPLNNFEDLATR
jgi:hypothetical protein